jgi:anti-anti-sigma regulatory factor
MLVVPIHDDVIVQLSGALDIDAIEAFEACMTRLLADKPRRLILELSALTDIDLAGTAGFDRARLAAHVRGVDLILDSPSDLVLVTLHSRANGKDSFFVR